MSLQTPRVLPSHLHAFNPSTSGPRSPPPVRLLGTVTALHGDTATITCGNHGDVTLILKPDSHLQMGKLVEVVGKVAEVEGVCCSHLRNARYLWHRRGIGLDANEWYIE